MVWKLCLVLFSFWIFPIQSLAVTDNQNKTYEARIERVAEEKEIELMESKQLYQKLEVKITNGDKKSETVTIENGDQPLANVIRYKVNDRVLINLSFDPDGNQLFFITDYIRSDGLMLLLIIFVGLTVAIARWKGLSSIVSMIFTFVVLFVFVLPKISAGYNPILIASVASVFIIPISFYLSHGLNRKTTVAILGSLIALVITSVLAYVFINLSHLTGFSSEEAGMLSIDKSGLINMKGLLLAGIVIGALGVLDDITVSQAAIVDELVATGKPMKPKDLYARAMNVGRDHITSMVNTLVLAYAGASLPLLLIFVGNPHPFSEIINYEMITEEIVRTLIGSIGLVLAVPITTLIAVNWFRPGTIPGNSQ